MKKFKRFAAILLSAVLLMSVIPFSVFADGIPDMIIYQYNGDHTKTFAYYKEIQVGENSTDDALYENRCFCSFVPQETGVYSFRGEIMAITADTNDYICSEKENERTRVLFSSSAMGNTKTGVFLTAGTRYFVLLEYLSAIEVEYYGTVTDVNPVHVLTNLVENYDVELRGEVNPYLYVRESFEFIFPDNKYVYINWAEFYDGEYTDNTLTLNALGFEKVFTYSTIDVHDIINHFYTEKPVELIRYFDGSVELNKPVEVQIILNGDESSTFMLAVLSFDALYGDVEVITGKNGRKYPVSLGLDEDGNLLANVANHFFYVNYTVKKAGLFKNLSRYFMLKEIILSNYIYDIEHGSSIIDVTKEYGRELMDLRLEFIKSLFSFK